MTKHKYNQGDMLRYHLSTPNSSQLLVIIGVFSESYEVLWPDHDGREPIKSYYFSTLDDSDDITLVARGQ